MLIGRLAVGNNLIAAGCKLYLDRAEFFQQPNHHSPNLNDLLLSILKVLSVDQGGVTGELKMILQL